MTDLDIIKECRQTGRTRTTTKDLLEKAYDKQMTNKPQTFQHISRAIDKNGVHHLDALDDYGQHWYATMQQKEELWLTYVQPWELRTH